MQNAFAGVDVGGTRIKIGLASKSGQLISHKILETTSCHDTESFLNAIASELRSAADAASVTILAAGIGCPGRIDFASGKIAWLKSKLEFLEGAPLAMRLGERLTCPVVCDNDVNAILAGEMRFGAGQGYRDVVAITVGTGIGGAFAIDGNLVRGNNWGAGHFGYISHNPQGNRHICGNRGVVEERASQSGVLKQIRRALEANEISPLTEFLAHGKEPGLHELFQASDAGDPLGKRLAERLISELGTLIANLIYVLDPQLVLVGGGLVNHRPSIVNALRHEATERLAYLPRNTTKIVPMALGDDAGILGGVALAMDAIAQRK